MGIGRQDIRASHISNIDDMLSKSGILTHRDPRHSIMAIMLLFQMGDPNLHPPSELLSRGSPPQQRPLLVTISVTGTSFAP